MLVAVLFDERMPQAANVAVTARRRILGTGVLQALERPMIIRSGSVLVGLSKHPVRAAEETFFSDAFALGDPDRLREAYRHSTIFTWTVANVTRHGAVALHEALGPTASYLGIHAVNLGLPIHVGLYRLSLGLLLRVQGRQCRVFFRGFDSTDRDHELFADVATLGFTDVGWEDIGLRDSIADDFDSLDHFARISDLRTVLTATLDADRADELVLMLEDLHPRLVATLGTAARAYLGGASAEDFAHTAISLRRYWEQLADVVFPPRPTPFNGREVTRDKIKNRLAAYIEERLAFEGAGDQEKLAVLGPELSRVLEHTSRAVHGTPTRESCRELVADLTKLSIAILSLRPETKPYLAYAGRFVEILRGPTGGA